MDRLWKDGEILLFVEMKVILFPEEEIPRLFNPFTGGKIQKPGHRGQRAGAFISCGQFYAP